MFCQSHHEGPPEKAVVAVIWSLLYAPDLGVINRFVGLLTFVGNQIVQGASDLAGQVADGLGSPERALARPGIPFSSLETRMSARGSMRAMGSARTSPWT